MTKEENERRLAHLKSIVLSLPDKPGSYQFYDEQHIIIYVGKAKNLKSRVSSYFHKEVDRFKTKVLVSKIFDISYTVVNTEEDALLLENSLIKKYNPRYNVLLKDGKTYPSICITNELYPRIFKTRTINKRLGTYYGPYSHVPTMVALLELIGKLYKPRTCHFPITREGIEMGKYKACLEYHIHNCDAPCVGKQSWEEYQENIRQAREILKGNTREVRKMLYEEMLKKAEELKFEEAEALKKRYILLDNYCAKSEVVSFSIADVDVFSITDDEFNRTAFINYLQVKNGTVNQSFTFEYKRKLDESNEDILASAIPEIRERFSSKAKEIIVPFEMEWAMREATFIVPQRGDKRRLLELSEMNGKQYKFDRLKQSEKLNPEQKAVRLMKELQTKLQMPRLPYRIECFDNSNIQGTNPVAACVVFKKAKQSKKDYRHFHIKTVVGPDDFASMREIVTRRYTRLLEEKEPLPQLIIIDGGKGQLNAATEVLRELNLLGKITIVGLAKRLEEIFYPGDPFPLVLDKTSETLKMIQYLRDEAHRFGITFHRHMRSKGQIVSELDTIKGIGEKTKEALLKKYKSVKRIREAPSAELEELIGKKKATLVAEGLGMGVR